MLGFRSIDNILALLAELLPFEIAFKMSLYFICTGVLPVRMSVPTDRSDSHS